MMAMPEMINKFFAQLDPDEVPVQYISAASYTLNGKEVILRGVELQRLIDRHPDYDMVKDAQIYINLKKVMNDITLEIDYIHAKVDELFRHKP
jgi:hypothetical protein